MKRRYLVLGSIIGAATMQVTIVACGKVMGTTSDAAISHDGEARADSSPALMATWSSYTPTFVFDGTAPSTSVRGGAFRYVTIDKTVCLQGMVMIGQQSSGTGGTRITISVPPGHPGASGVKQYGIGSVIRVGDTTTMFPGGAGAIEDDLNNFVLVKSSTDYFTAGDARPGAGIVWTASGCYESI